MKRSIDGHWLPQSQPEAAQLAKDHQLRYQHCVSCKRDLTAPEAAATVPGWQETQISGMCEPCFDECFPLEDDGPDGTGPAF